jgi:Glycosyltransferase family 92
MFSLVAQLKRLIQDGAYRRSWRYRVRHVASDLTSPQQYYLTTTTIVRNEAKYIREFVAFHKLVGVDHMLIYMDGGFDRETADALHDFVIDGFVELISWPRLKPRRNNQFLAYKNAVERLCHQTKWLAMIDADEFLFAPSSSDLRGELKAREQFMALSVYSHTFGTGGVERILAGELVTEQLTWRGPTEHVKNRTQRTIVQPQAVAAIRSANTVVLRGTDCLGWDEAGQPVFATGEIHHESKRLRINHYFTRAEEDFRLKLARRYFGKYEYAAKMAGKHNEATDKSLSLVKDTELHQFLPYLKPLVEMHVEAKVREQKLEGAPT